MLHIFISDSTSVWVSPVKFPLNRYNIISSSMGFTDSGKNLMENNVNGIENIMYPENSFIKLVRLYCRENFPEKNVLKKIIPGRMPRIIKSAGVAMFILKESQLKK